MNIFFRTDASNQIGTGHLMRCLALADALQKRGDHISFICRTIPKSLMKHVSEKGYIILTMDQFMFNTSEIPEKSKQEIDAKETIRILENQKNVIDWLIVDHYDLDERWESQISPHVKKIMVIDDLADRKHNCDLLLDQNLFEHMDERYEGLVPEQCKKLLGPKYVLFRSEFIEQRQKTKVREGKVSRILISFGGNDPTNETLKTLKAIKSLKDSKIIIDVVIGSSNPYKEIVRSFCQQLPNINYYCQVSNMAEIMREADLAIGAGGTTTWERLYLGLPTIMIIVANNQMGVAQDLEKRKLIWNLGWYEQVTEEQILQKLQFVLNHPDEVKEMSEKAICIIENQGDELKVLQYLK